jgi:hypothetical protein
VMIIGSSLVLKPHVGIFLGLQNSSKPITWRPNVCAVYRVRPWHSRPSISWLADVGFTRNHLWCPACYSKKLPNQKLFHD